MKKFFDCILVCYYSLYTLFFLLVKNKSNKIFLHRNGKTTQATFWNFPKGLRIKCTGNNNKLHIHFPHDLKTSSFILVGNGATVHIMENCRLYRSAITLEGENARIFLGKQITFRNTKIYCGKGNRPVIKIGNNCSTEGMEIIAKGSPRLFIGEDCMFASNITIRLTDSHTIYDRITGEIINKQTRPARIGRHTWIGQNVFLTKNISLPPNSIIGLGSVVGGVFTEEYTCIAGNPARVIKKDVMWSRELQL